MSRVLASSRYLQSVPRGVGRLRHSRRLEGGDDCDVQGSGLASSPRRKEQVCRSRLGRARDLDLATGSQCSGCSSVEQYVAKAVMPANASEVATTADGVVPEAITFASAGGAGGG